MPIGDTIFADIDAMSHAEAHKLLVWRRWGSRGPVCPKCDSKSLYSFYSRARFECRSCKTQFTATSGTPFSYRKLGAKGVLKIACLLDESKISDRKIMRVLNVSRGAVPSIRLLLLEAKKHERKIFADLSEP